MEWVGSVEIHIQASGWIEHKHNTDAAYENVILHVVWRDDKPVKRDDGSRLPTLELKNRVDEQLLLHYRKLMHSPEVIPCSSALGTVSQLVRNSMLDKVFAERLAFKADEVYKMLQRNNSDWEETCYQLLTRNFGFKINNAPFQQLAQSLPYKLLLKHADKLLQVEALLFGQAGFLENENDEAYYQLLQREYRLLGQKYQLFSRSLSKVQWRFLRLRPANFPTIRIAQLASLVYCRKHLFSSILEIDSVNGFFAFFSTGQSNYWLHHFRFFNTWKDTVGTMGKASIGNIIINTVAPILAAYGKSKNEEVYIDRAVSILQNLQAESNNITKQWRASGMSVSTAFDSQAVVELYNNYCLKRRCLNCRIGTALVNPIIP